MKYISLIILSLFCVFVRAQDKPNQVEKTVIFQVSNLPDSFYKKPLLPNDGLISNADGKMVLSTKTVGSVALKNSMPVFYEENISQGNAKWVLNTKSPIYITSDITRGAIAEPGDSIHIDFKNKEPLITGFGAEKIKLNYEIEQALKSIPQPTKYPVFISSLNDYLEWNAYVDEQLALVVPLIESYKNKISSTAYNVISYSIPESIELQRIQAFGVLHQKVSRGKILGIAIKNLIEICDSTLNKSVSLRIRSVSDLPVLPEFYLNMMTIQVYRKYDFDIKNEAINTPVKINVLLYHMAKQNYKGLTRERLLAYIIAKRIIAMDYNEPQREVLINDYYQQQVLPDYRNWVMNYERYRMSRGRMVKGRRGAEFTLFDQHGKAITKNSLAGKFVFMNFWETGNEQCILMAEVLHKVQHFFKNNPQIVFLHISADKNKTIWLNSIKQGKYTTMEGTHVRAGVSILDYPILKAYNVTSYPNLHFLDPNGRNAELSLEDEEGDMAKQIIDQIINHQVMVYDGPYVLEKENLKHAYSIVGTDVRDKILDGQKRELLSVQTDLPGKMFKIELKPELTVEATSYTKPEKLFCLSDIEGNFDAFRKLLQSNKIIDGNYNWIFGNGHLVFAGDMFDRGKQVTECLWLIYSLERKAKTAGGYVHFIMGNHEIMNLSNDIRYVHDKYKENAKLLGLEYVKLYDHYSELGRWLRTKNVMEKIGDLLFLHAGISPEINRLDLNLDDINNLSRKYYAGRLDSTNTALMTLFGGKTSPFWFRGYYGDRSKIKTIPSKYQLDSTFRKFEVKRIVTGHTIVRDTISVWYGNRVINIDTKHKEGKSEALLIEGTNFYRVNAEGQRVLLFRDEEK
jgi:thiol-disulfide isomerase/thioredoxin